MTRPSQKRLERLFVGEAAKRLGKSWNLGPDRECPDFTVTEGEHQFGLEVCEIFTGPENGSGSASKRAESDMKRRIDAVRREYEKIEDIRLTAKFVGDPCAENLAKVVPALLELNLPNKSVGYHVVADIDTGLRAGLKGAYHNRVQARLGQCNGLRRVGGSQSHTAYRCDG